MPGGGSALPGLRKPHHTVGRASPRAGDFTRHLQWTYRLNALLSAHVANQNYPFEVVISGSRRNVALADQIKNLDWRARNAVKKGTATAEELDAVRIRAKVLIR